MSAMSVTSSPIEVIPRPRLYLAGGTDVDRRCDPASRLAITRRGRLTLTLSTLLVLAIVLIFGSSIMAPASAGTQVVVQPGQTLSEVAATELPSVPLDRAIVEIQLANQMNTAQVQTGQTLLIP